MDHTPENKRRRSDAELAAAIDASMRASRYLDEVDFDQVATKAFAAYEAAAAAATAGTAQKELAQDYARINPPPFWERGWFGYLPVFGLAGCTALILLQREWGLMAGRAIRENWLPFSLTALASALVGWQLQKSLPRIPWSDMLSATVGLLVMLAFGTDFLGREVSRRELQQPLLVGVASRLAAIDDGPYVVEVQATPLPVTEFALQAAGLSVPGVARMNGSSCRNNPIDCKVELVWQDRSEPFAELITARVASVDKVTHEMGHFQALRGGQKLLLKYSALLAADRPIEANQCVVIGWSTGDPSTASILRPIRDAPSDGQPALPCEQRVLGLTTALASVAPEVRN